MISVILCAAGSGSRAKQPVNKVLRELHGMPVLCHSLSAFSFCDEILVACREEDEARILPLLPPNARTVRGGGTRFESVYSALREAKGEIVLVHDAARPFVSRACIDACIQSVKTYGSGIAAVPVSDTVARAEDGLATEIPPRESLYALQTPQGFRTDDLRFAYERAAADGRRGFTDDSGVYAAYVAQPRLCAGDVQNRKLTYPSDFGASRVGFGVDTHAFDIPPEYSRGIARLNLNYIVLGGIAIPSNHAIKAHSDGDVAVHALMDALLSAAGKRDIGWYFPDSDPAYLGADSMKLLGRVMEIVREEGFTVRNASISILAEQPRLSPYIGQITDSLKHALGCEAVAVAAGTNEKLGYIGEGKGITAYAFVLLD